MPWPQQKSLKQQVQAKPQTQAIHQKGQLLLTKWDLQGQCQTTLQRTREESHQSEELPHSLRWRHSGAEFERTTRPITMMPTGSKTNQGKPACIISEIIRRRHSNYKATGCDRVANFWLKQLTSLHPELGNAYNTISKHRQQSPQWLTEGVTFVLPKQKTQRALKTGLSHAYQLFTRSWPPSLQKGPTLFHQKAKGYHCMSCRCKD